MNIYRIYLLVFIFMSCISCKKYLDEKPLKSITVPSTLAELESILNFHTRMNQQSSDMTEFLTDNIYVNDDTYNAGRENERMNYTWESQASDLTGWTRCYETVYVANFILDALQTIGRMQENAEQYDRILATALFHRAFYFFQLAQLYCKPYSPTSATDPGIVLKQTAAVEEPLSRATVEQTYQQIITDIERSKDHLPGTAAFPTTPVRAAAYGLLARVYLSMREYPKARLQADTCLQLHNALLDYNSIIPAGSPAIPAFNPEIMYFNNSIGQTRLLAASRSRIDSVLYRSYEETDLRRELFFRENSDNSFSFRGSYAGNKTEGTLFDGIATDEILLIRAECLARENKTEAALADVNQLLEKRYLTGTFVPVVAADATAAVAVILQERRKELVFRGLRWSDLRRFNLEGHNISLQRLIGGTTYHLPAGDPRWVALIPQEVIERSSYEQNPR